MGMGKYQTEVSPAPNIRVTTGSYFIDIREVTNSEFIMFLDMTGYKADRFYINDETDPNEPAIVIWEYAAAYAKWVGKRLPTEIEWEKAARGGLEESMFTWGNSQPTFDDSRKFQLVDHGIGRARMAKEGAFVWHGAFDDDADGVGGRDAAQEFAMQDVMSYLPNAYGLFDMIGNAQEWCSDEWNVNAYLLIINDIEPKNKDGYHVVRGGGNHHSIRTFNNWSNNLDSLNETLQERYLRRTIHVGERKGSNSAAGFRLVLGNGDFDNGHDFLRPWKSCPVN